MGCGGDGVGLKAGVSKKKEEEAPLLLAGSPRDLVMMLGSFRSWLVEPYVSKS